MLDFCEHETLMRRAYTSDLFPKWRRDAVSEKYMAMTADEADLEEAEADEPDIESTGALISREGLKGDEPIPDSEARLPLTDTPTDGAGKAMTDEQILETLCEGARGAFNNLLYKVADEKLLNLAITTDGLDGWRQTGIAKRIEAIKAEQADPAEPKAKKGKKDSDF